MIEEAIEVVEELEINLLGKEVPTSRFERFKHRNGAYYAYVEIDAELLTTRVPEGAKWGVIVEDDEPRQKTLLEFVGRADYSKDDSSVIIPCCAIEKPILRQKPVTKGDMEDWEFYLYAVFGIEIDDLLTIDARKELLASEDYNGEG